MLSAVDSTIISPSTISSSSQSKTRLSMLRLKENLVLSVVENKTGAISENPDPVFWCCYSWWCYSWWEWGYKQYWLLCKQHIWVLGVFFVCLFVWFFFKISENHRTVAKTAKSETKNVMSPVSDHLLISHNGMYTLHNYQICIVPTSTSSFHQDIPLWRENISAI